MRFWQDNNGNWIPYSNELSARLEAIIEQHNCLPHRVEVTKDPPRVVVQSIDGTFRQYRIGKRGNLEGRAVRRGYLGQTTRKKEDSHTAVVESSPSLSIYDKGTEHFFGAYFEGNSGEHYKALECFRIGIESKDINCMLMLCLYHLCGWGNTLLDEEEAICWIKKACQTLVSSDIIQTQAAAIEWYNLIIDDNCAGREELFSAIIKKWSNIDPKTVIIY